MKKINWKKGSGSTYLGIVIMLLAFSAVVVIINIFNLFYTQTRAQIITDAAGDAGAVAAINPGGFDEEKMEEVAKEVFALNKIAFSPAQFSISAENELDANGNPTGNKLVTAKSEITENHFLPQYLDHNDRFKVSATAVIRAEVPTDSNGWIAQSFYNNASAVLPFATTSAGNRNAAYTTWFIQHYLAPEYNSLYKTENYNTHTEWFIFDYLYCMGFSPADIRRRSVSEWYDYFSSSQSQLDGWLPTNALSAQYAANEGKPVVIMQKKDDNSYDLYVVVPNTAYLENGYIATAHCGIDNWNYKRIKISDLSNGANYIVSIHE